ncbi:MAG TPA: cation transporter, partial [Pseudomonas sp.]|nr:cation transporter [Pseudomonas sp.]
MSDCNHAQWQPPHDYRPLERRSERRTWAVVILT